jgi:predicted unusual protein kinase regulating ubiquinone biosynthesis (AarF/ABC1/UbiB family)
MASLLESANISRIRLLMQDMMRNKDIVVPLVNEQLSGSRVLTMSFEEGFHATDLASIEECGLDKADIARLLSTTFCEQMYRHGKLYWHYN